MLINLAFIKAPNGLFYYALDYIAELADVTSRVLVRTPALADALHRRFPGLTVEVTPPLAAARAVRAAGTRGEMVFTPSSHPIPAAGRQLVIVHDSFPFEGAKGALKAAAFFLAMRTSRATGGYINTSDARAFLRRGLRDDRLRFAPNHIAAPAAPPRTDPLIVPEAPVIGLFGTDSPKKNYEPLFAAIRARGGSPARFRLYGQANPYAAAMIAAFPTLDIAVTDSATTGMEEFIASIDILASAATREGFSRPMALALSMGVPSWTVEAPVYREFYTGAATFHADVAALGAAIAGLSPGAPIDRPRFAMAERLQQDFRQCIAWLREQDRPAR